MSDRLPISDDSILVRWMRVEIGKINDGLVSQRRTLAELLSEDRPVSRTKAGQEHVYDREILEELGEKLPSDMQENLRCRSYLSQITRFLIAAILMIP